MIDREEFQRWRDAALDARRAAEVQRSAALHSWACFLAEQSAQLLVKGLLHGLGCGPWGHDLVVLGESVERETGADLPDPVRAALRRLSRHYIPARYPDAHPRGTPGAHYGPEDTTLALDDLAAVFDHMGAIWQHLDEQAARADEAGSDNAG